MKAHSSSLLLVTMILAACSPKQASTVKNFTTAKINICVIEEGDHQSIPFPGKGNGDKNCYDKGSSCSWLHIVEGKNKDGEPSNTTYHVNEKGKLETVDADGKIVEIPQPKEPSPGSGSSGGTGGSGGDGGGSTPEPKDPEPETPANESGGNDSNGNDSNGNDSNGGDTPDTPETPDDETPPPAEPEPDTGTSECAANSTCVEQEENKRPEWVDPRTLPCAVAECSPDDLVKDTPQGKIITLPLTSDGKINCSDPHVKCVQKEPAQSESPIKKDACMKTIDLTDTGSGNSESTSPACSIFPTKEGCRKQGKKTGSTDPLYCLKNPNAALCKKDSTVPGTGGAPKKPGGTVPVFDACKINPATPGCKGANPATPKPKPEICKTYPNNPLCT